MDNNCIYASVNMFGSVGTIDDIHNDDFTKNVETFYGCYGKIIAQVKNHASKAKLIMVKIMTNGHKSRTMTVLSRILQGITEYLLFPLMMTVSFQLSIN